MIYYAGIGSRSIPYSILTRFFNLGKELPLLGYILRSGGATGSDRAFEDGCKSVKGNKEIYLPWKGFNNSDSPLIGGMTKEALESIAKYHPNPQALSEPATKLMGRNFNQVYGHNSIASKFCLCYTQGGQLIGGTSQALRIILGEVPDCVIINFGFKSNDKITSEFFSYKCHCECGKKLILLDENVGCVNCGFLERAIPQVKKLLEADNECRRIYTGQI